MCSNKRSFASFFIPFYIILVFLVMGRGKEASPFQVEVYGTGQPMLLLPGALCSGEVWDETVEYYKDRYQLHVITLAGYAGTEPLADGPYLETYKSAIIQYIYDNDLRDVILLGHSLGGFLSMWIGSEMESRLDRIMIVDALPFLAQVFNPAATAGFDSSRAEAYLQANTSADEQQLEQSKRMVLASMISDPQRIEQALTWSLSSDPRTEAYSMTELMSTDLRDTIAAIKVPVLVLAAFVGENPQMPQYTRESTRQVYAAQYKAVNNLTLHVADGARHFIMWDDPEWYFEKTDAFLGTYSNQ